MTPETTDPRPRDPLDGELLAIARWPCTGHGPGVHVSPQGLWRPLPAVLGAWEAALTPGAWIRNWHHGRPVGRPDHERRVTLAVVVQPCPAIGKRPAGWSWAARVPALHAPLQRPDYGEGSSWASSLAEAQARADEALGERLAAARQQLVDFGGGDG